MAQSPYSLKDGTHVLTQFGKRTNTLSKVWELRVNMNGWKAQHLVHNASNFSDLTAQDLAAYATDRKIRADSHAVASVAATIRGSKPLNILRSYSGNTSITTRDEGYCQGRSSADLMALADACDRLATDNGVFKVKISENYDRNLVNGVWSIWSETAKANVITDSLRANKSFQADTSCFDSPVNRFKTMIAEHLRIPFAHIHFYGRGCPTPIGGSVTYSNYMSKWMNEKGFTVIYSPRDVCGLHGIFIVPKIPGVRAVLIGSRVGYYTDSNPVMSYGGAQFDAALVAASGIRVQYAPGKGWTTQAEAPYESCYIIRDVAPVVGVVTPAQAGLETAAYAKLGSPTILVKGSDGTWGSYVDGCDLSCYRLSGVFYALPSGFGDILFDSPGVTSVTTQDDYTPTLGVQPIKVNATLKMQTVRAYLLAKSKTPGLKPTEIAELVKGYEDSKAYADALLYCTVYHNGWTYPSKADIEKLEIVKLAREADKDLMIEDLGKGETLTKVAAKFDKLRVSGTLAYAAVTMVDDVLRADEVVSPFLAERFHPWLWNVIPVVSDAGAIVAYHGRYAKGSEESITQDDALALIANSCTVSLPIGLTMDSVYADLGITAGDSAAYADMFAPALPGGSGRVFDGVRSVPKLAFGPAEFRDVLGYPVLNIIEEDSRNRSLIVLKGIGQDLQGIFLTLFFLNQLDMI